MPTPRVVKVFIASPGDLTIERRAFKEVVDDLNKGYGRGANITFEPLGWEDALSSVGRRSQSVINQDVDACDVFVLVMWRRWGQEAADAAPYSSYTEEEFYRAVARYEKDGKPTIFVFFKDVESGQIADAGPQLAKVLAFRRKLSNSKTALYRNFDDEQSFRSEIDKHLVAFVENRCQMIGAIRALPIVPDSIRAELDKQTAETERLIDELERLRATAKEAQEELERSRALAKDAVVQSMLAERVAEARAGSETLTLARSAAKKMSEGLIEEARQEFAKALDGTTNLRVIHLGFKFYSRCGELAEAESLMRRYLAICGPDSMSDGAAYAFANLGQLRRVAGDLPGSYFYHRQALAIYELHRDQDGIKWQCKNLGDTLFQQGCLDEAERMFRRALQISTDAGEIFRMGEFHIDVRNVLEAMGDMERSREMCLKARDLFSKIGLGNQVNDLQKWLDDRPK